MPAKKHNPLQNPHRAPKDDPVRVSENIEEMDSFPQAVKPRQAFMLVDGKRVVEFVKFGQIMLARCEDETMYLNSQTMLWQPFVFEILSEEG